MDEFFWSVAMRCCGSILCVAPSLPAGTLTRILDSRMEGRGGGIHRINHECSLFLRALLKCQQNPSCHSLFKRDLPFFHFFLFHFGKGNEETSSFKIEFLSWRLHILAFSGRKPKQECYRVRSYVFFRCCLNSYGIWDRSLKSGHEAYEILNLF